MEANGFTPLLTTTDWNDEWKSLQRFRGRADDASYWNKRSASFTTKDAPNPYVDRFLDLAGIREGETVFDMGCGTGAIAIPLAQRGHKVVAADFSQGMLDVLASNMDAAGVSSVFPKLMSWEEDWEAHGVREGMVDVCVASRSIATEDLEDALLRLHKVARRRVCLTVTTGSSPRIDESFLRELGIEDACHRDYLYVVNILASNGIKPQLSYIESRRKDTFESEAEAFETFGRMVDDATRGNEQARQDAHRKLSEWLPSHLVENENAGRPDRKGIPEGPLRLDRPRTVSWAFVSWDK